MRIGEQVVEHVGVEGNLLRHLLAEFVALEHLAVLLAVSRPEGHLGSVPLNVAALLVLFDPPAAGREGVGIAVDDVGDDLDGGLAETNLPQLRKGVSLAQPLQVFGRKAFATAGQLQFVGLTDVEHIHTAHGRILYAHATMFLSKRRRLLVGSEWFGLP